MVSVPDANLTTDSAPPHDDLPPTLGQSQQVELSARLEHEALTRFHGQVGYIIANSAKSTVAVSGGQLP
jgi:hypothetical protein